MKNALSCLLLLFLATPGRGEDSPPVLLDFCAEWCAACREMRPTIEAIRAAGYRVERIDVDQNRPLAAKYNVESLPCFVMEADGRETDRVVGQTSYGRLEAMFSSTGRRQSTVTEAPTPAWRYERPAGHRAAIVRIYCQDDAGSLLKRGTGSELTGANTAKNGRGEVPVPLFQQAARTRSIGSGTLVKWGGKILVVTARHVVKDATKIIVELHTKKTHWAKVVSVDATWDCAVLELIGQPVGVEPATIELGPTALPRDGDKLESCGYGPDGRLACNSGRFVGYRRSAAAPNGPDDWMVISGHARGGDSGGPVFNERGCVVGVLWGTDGKEVVCVQAGRVHATLEAALPGKPQAIEQRAVVVEGGSGKTFEQRAVVVGGGNTKKLSEQTGILQRTPTPPMPGPEPYAPLVPVPPISGCGPRDCPNFRGHRGEAVVDENGTVPFGAEQAGFSKKPALPWRGDTQKRDDSQQAAIDRLIELERIRQERLDREAARPVPVESPRPQPEVKPEADEPSPLIAGLCVLGAVAVGFVIYFATQKS